MGDLQYVSFNRAVSDEQFTRMLKTIVDAHYSDYYEVEYLRENYWVVRLKQGLLTEEDGYKPEQLENGDAQDQWSFHFVRATNYSKKVDGEFPLHKGKFGHEHPPVGDWGWWFADQLHGHFAEKFHTVSTHDSCAGSWKPNPATCPTYADFSQKRYSFYRSNPKLLGSVYNGIPRGLRTLRD